MNQPQIKDLCTVTYTNSKCHDVLRVYVGQKNRFASGIKSYILTDRFPDFDVSGHTVLIYQDSDPYYVQWLKSLEYISEKFIIYQQEDFFLDGDVDYQEIKRCCDFLTRREDYSFVRLLKIALQGAIHRKELKMKEFPDIEIEKNLFDCHTLDPDSFAFMMQSSIWKKTDFINLYNHVKSSLWLESREWDKGMRDLSIKGVFYYRGSRKEGLYHWNPEIWPHVCTAVGKGKWSLSHHGERLASILREYNINPRERGTR